MAEQQEGRVAKWERHGRAIFGLIGTVLAGGILYVITTLAQDVGENSALTTSVRQMSKNVSDMKEVVVRLDERQAQAAKKFRDAIEDIGTELDEVESEQAAQDKRINENERRIDRIESRRRSSTPQQAQDN